MALLKKNGIVLIPLFCWWFFLVISQYIQCFFSVSVERALPHSFWSLCVVWGSDVWKVKPAEWVRLGRQGGGSLRSRVQANGKARKSPELFLLPVPLLLCSGPPPLSIPPPFPTLICKAIQLPLSCPNPGDAHSSCQSNLVSIFLSKEPFTPRKIMPFPSQAKVAAGSCGFK